MFGRGSGGASRQSVTSQRADLKKCKHAFQKFGASEGRKGWTFLTAGQLSDRIETRPLLQNTPQGEFCVMGGLEITIGENHQAFWTDVRLDRACFLGNFFAM